MLKSIIMMLVSYADHVLGEAVRDFTAYLFHIDHHIKQLDYETAHVYLYSISLLMRLFFTSLACGL